jgi:hypothetical protein
VVSSAADSLPRSVALVWVVVSSFEVIVDFESANTSPITAGLNAIASPNVELALRKPRRELSSGCFTVFSVRVVLGFEVLGLCGRRVVIPFFALNIKVRNG